MSTVTFGGRVGRDPEDIKSGVKVSVAEDVYNRDEREKGTRWWSVVIFGKRADFVRQYVRKGDAVHVVGEMSVKVGRDGDRIFFDCNASQGAFEKLAGGSDGAARSSGNRNGGQRGGSSQGQQRGGGRHAPPDDGPDFPDDFGDDDIPW